MELLIFIGVVVLLGLIFGFGSFVTTQQQEVKIIERFGKFKHAAYAGISYKAPFIDSVAGEINLKLQQLDVEVDTKTQDNVFVKLVASIQYQIPQENAVNAFYKLQNPKEQISSFVFDTVRSQVPKLTLDDVFAKKDDIATAVDEQLEKTMTEFGYHIYKVLVTEIDPAQSVKDAMNEIQTQTRLALAAQQKGAANKTLLIAAAEAEKETKRLSGEGIAAERQAIVDGMKASVEDLAKATGLSAEEVMRILMMTQYYDTMKSIGTTDGNRVIMIPFGVDGADKVREAIIAGSAAAK